MKDRQLFMVLSLCLLTWTSCKKEVDQFIPFLEPISFDFSGEFTNSSDTLHFTVTGRERMTLTTPKGSEFIVKSDMFEYTDGTFCACEQVEVKVIELDKKRDFVVHQKPTISDSQMLISAGAYHFSATYQGRPLQMIADEQLCLIMPSTTLDSEMELFYGEEKSGQFNWTPADAVPESRAFVKAGEWQTDSSFIVGYECFSDRLGWINIDKLASDGSLNPVCVKLDEFYTKKNTVMFAVLVEEKAILNLYYDELKQGFCLANIPQGMKVQFVGIHKKGDDLYELGSEKTTISNNHFQSLSFEPQSFASIKSFLAGL